MCIYLGYDSILHRRVEINAIRKVEMNKIDFVFERSSSNSANKSSHPNQSVFRLFLILLKCTAEIQIRIEFSYYFYNIF